MAENKRELWTVAQAAEVMGCSQDTVRRLISAGKLPSINVSVRLTRIDPADVEIYLAERKTRRQPEAPAPRRGRRRTEPPRGGINNSGYYPGMKVV